MSQELFQNSLSDYVVMGKGTQIMTYVVPIKVFLSLSAKRWGRQRPIEDDRIPVIANIMAERKRADGMLLLAWSPSEHLVVYDGQHRWRAIESMSRDIEFNIVIQIMWNCSEEDIIADFFRINQAKSVPELYQTPHVTADVKADIEEYIRDLAKNYPEFMSTTKKPNRPNFNRDLLCDELFKIWKDYFKQEKDMKTIIAGLDSLNKKYHESSTSSARHVLAKSIKSLEKCEKHKFWLFADRDIDRAALRKEIE